MKISITALIGFVVFVLILTALAPTVIEQTYTGSCDIGTANLSTCNMENASSSAQAMYTLIEILFPLIAIFGLLAIIGIGKKKS